MAVSFIQVPVCFKRLVIIILTGNKNSVKSKKMTHRKTEIHKARTIGAYFLLVFIAYGLGRHLFETEEEAGKYIGALLILANSIMVLFIGIYIRKTLQRYSTLIGNLYSLARVIEAVALLSILLNLVPAIHIDIDYPYFIAMFVLGLGSIPMCLALYKNRILPAWLAIWGFIGYTVFAFGFLMELFGKNWSMYLLALAGLWEITFGIWLIAKSGIKKSK
jgi:hypothetical protein